MSEGVAGRIFSTPEEAGVTPPTEAEIAHARKLFDEFQEQIDNVAEADIRRKSRRNSSTTSRAPSTRDARGARR
jgi:hypothetical protein